MELTPEELLRDLAWLRRIARSLTRDADDADEVVQEALIAATAQPRPSGPVRAWLRGIVRNLARAQARARARRVVREAAADAPSSETPDAVLEMAVALSVLVRFLLELDEPYRTPRQRTRATSTSGCSETAPTKP
jgi:RNA polymerase sigma-70 factor (ECF subfamily)